MSNTFKVGDVTTTRNGRKARIICVNRAVEDYPVIALIMDGGVEVITSHTADGLHLGGVGGSTLDLMPVPRLEDLKVDTPLLVRDREDQTWKRRHFATVDSGRATCWNGGATSWTAAPSSNPTTWNFWRLP